MSGEGMIQSIFSFPCPPQLYAEEERKAAYLLREQLPEAEFFYLPPRMENSAEKIKRVVSCLYREMQKQPTDQKKKRCRALTGHNEQKSWL